MTKPTFSFLVLIFACTVLSTAAVADEQVTFTKDVAPILQAKCQTCHHAGTVAPMTLVVANLVGAYGENYQVLTAASFLSMALPLIVFFSLQRYFVRALTEGAVKH